MLINEKNYKNDDLKSDLESVISEAYEEAYNEDKFNIQDIPLRGTEENPGIIERLTSDSRAGSLDEDRLVESIQMMQSQERYMNETNFSANVSQFVPKLPMLLRRIQSNMFAFEVAGVQPVPTPDTSIYVLKAQYAGDTSTAARTASRDDSRILVMRQADTAVPVAIGNQLTSASGAQGTVVYTETRPDEDGGNDILKVIINVTTGTFLKAEEVDVGASFADGGNELTILDVFSNEAGFKQILSGYSGPHTTAQGEVLGTQMRQIRVNITKQNIVVVTRKLKAEITLELIQDMKSQHNAQADKEVMYFLEKEITDDINIEIIEAYKDISIALADFQVNDITNENSRHDTDKYVRLYNRILADKRDLSERNQRGSGNMIVATGGVITALEALGKFKDFGLGGSVKTAENYSMPYVGTLIDGTKVYQDFFTEVATGKDYYMPIYKGAGNYDAGVVYSPYQTLMPLEATNYLTLQPVIGIQSRYAITKNNLLDTGVSGASDYCSIRYVTFTGSALA